MLLAGQHAATQVREFFVVDGDEAVKKALGKLVSLHCAPRLLFMCCTPLRVKHVLESIESPCVRIYEIVFV